MKNILLVMDMQKGFSRYEQTKRLTYKIEELLNKHIFDKVIAIMMIIVSMKRF